MGRPPHWGAAEGGACVSDHKSLWICLIYSLYIPYIYFLAMFHIFSLVCFLIYGVKTRSGHERSQSFGEISRVLGPKLTFFYKFLWCKIIRNTDPRGRPPSAAAPLGCRRRRCLCFWLSYIINVYGYSFSIPCIFHIPYIFTKDVPSIFPCVYLKSHSFA